jgi:2-dehydropantoate 2-reductase
MSDAQEGADGTVVVVGAGAIGTVLAASLWRSGLRVDVLTKPADAARTIAREGLTVRGAGPGRLVARPRVAMSASDVRPSPSAVFLVTKAAQVEAAACEVLPVLGEDTAVVALQNACVDEAVAAVAGPRRALGCVVGWGATLVRPGLALRTSPGGFTLGAFDARAERLVAGAARLLRACAPVRVTRNLAGARYAKLVVNSCLTTLGAVSGLNLKGILASAAGRRLFLAVATEALDAARAAGVELEPVDGLDVRWLYSHGPEARRRLPLARPANALALAAMSLLRGGVVSSSLQSLRRGEPTEVEWLNGHVAALARAHGTPSPVNERLVRMVREIERGTRPIRRGNLSEALRAT